MKSITYKTIFACLAIFTSTFTFAQANFQGVATYESKTTMDLGEWGGRELSPERKKMIMDRMKSMFEKTYTLTFNRSESEYKEEEKLAAPGAGMGRFGGMMGSFTAGSQYKNVKDGEIIQDQEFFGKQFLIKDELQKLEWKMTGETKQIGQYMCMKAVAMKKVDEMDWSNMRRRRGNRNAEKEENTKEENTKVEDTTKSETVDLTKNPLDLIETPKEIEVVAWYTMQIPVNQGPAEYWGLPGLILEVNSGKTTILCSKIVMNPADKKDIKKPTKGKEVTKKAYNGIIKKKMEEMREMYGGRNREGRRGF